MKKAHSKRWTDLTGQKFHRLQVVEFVYKDTSGHSHWQCICECGNECQATTHKLTSGRKKSCGCLIAEETGNRFRKPDGERGKNQLFEQYKHEAEKRGLYWDLSKRDFLAITSADCFYCGIKPGQKKGGVPHLPNYHGQFIYNGVDRVDPSLGYFLSNVTPCCKACNFAKQGMDYNEFIGWASTIASYSRPDSYPRPEEEIKYVKGNRWHPSPAGAVGRNIMFSKYRRRAHDCGASFDLTFSDCIHLMQQNCHYCGQEPAQVECSRKNAEEKERTKFVYNGLDRKQSTGDYTYDNLVPSCALCNRGKHVQGYDEFLSRIKVIASKRKRNDEAA